VTPDAAISDERARRQLLADTCGQNKLARGSADGSSLREHQESSMGVWFESAHIEQ